MGKILNPKTALIVRRREYFVSSDFVFDKKKLTFIILNFEPKSIKFQTGKCVSYGTENGKNHRISVVSEQKV